MLAKRSVQPTKYIIDFSVRPALAGLSRNDMVYVRQSRARLVEMTEGCEARSREQSGLIPVEMTKRDVGMTFRSANQVHLRFLRAVGGADLSRNDRARCWRGGRFGQPRRVSFRVQAASADGVEKS